MIKKIISIFIAAIMLSGLIGCGKTESESQDSKIDYYYEAVFLDNDEIADLFVSVRGEEPPFEILTKDYHVTTEFMSEEVHPDWYGKDVNVHITAYKAQEVEMDDGNMTSNEGLKVEVSAEDKDLDEYLKNLEKNYHITGSYKDAAKYTNNIDFSDGEPLDIYVTGTFGCSHSDGTIDFGK